MANAADRIIKDYGRIGGTPYMFQKLETDTGEEFCVRLYLKDKPVLRKIRLMEDNLEETINAIESFLSDGELDIVEVSGTDYLLGGEDDEEDGRCHIARYRNGGQLTGKTSLAKEDLEELRDMLREAAEDAGISVRSEIGEQDFVVRANSFYCDKHHRVEEINARVRVTGWDSKTEWVSVSAGYCVNCGIYFILKRDYQRLCGLGLVRCNITTEELFRDYGLAAFDEDRYALREESVLHRCGYNVNAQNGLRRTDRREIIAFVIENGIQTPKQVCNLLTSLIERNGNKRSMETAVGKWQEDYDFASGYGMLTRRKVNITAIVEQRYRYFR